jgi:hypothetical protein
MSKVRLRTQPTWGLDENTKDIVITIPGKKTPYGFFFNSKILKTKASVTKTQNSIAASRNPRKDHNWWLGRKPKIINSINTLI